MFKMWKCPVKLHNEFVSHSISQRGLHMARLVWFNCWLSSIICKHYGSRKMFYSFFGKFWADKHLKSKLLLQFFWVLQNYMISTASLYRWISYQKSLFCFFCVIVPWNYAKKVDRKCQNMMNWYINVPTRNIDPMKTSGARMWWCT